MKLFAILCCAGWAVLWIAVARGFADEPISTEDAELFRAKVQPLLMARCFECHGAEKQESNLRLDSLGAILAGGDYGPAIVPGRPEESRLVTAIGYLGDLKMPPRSKLPPEEIELLTEWVRRGAPWPDAAPSVAETTPAVDRGFTDEERQFWAFQPPVAATPPDVGDPSWAASPIDRFILARLEAEGLSPVAPADRRTLIRRATFDLTGLPPTLDEVAAFLADESPAAFARVVDRLLASPRYGERWGRHWLDVARYADSNGLDENLAYANAYRYRDYVVAAFNADKPYDEFVREQVAGDLLSGAVEPADCGERVVATGFLTLGAKMLAEDDPVKMQMDIIDEQVDTLGRTFLGLTLGCARCHDHKFDPVRIDDYYALAGIFKSTKTMENFRVVAKWQERPLGTPEQLRTQRDHAERVAAAKTELERMVQAANDELLGTARRRAGKYLLAAERERRIDEILAATSPLGDSASGDADGPAGATIVEAENFVRGNVVRDFTAYGDPIGVIYNAGELPNFAEYEIALTEPGTYRVELRYAAAESRPVSLAVNGRVARAAVAARVTGSWQVDSQRWSAEAYLRLVAGTSVIRLERSGPFPHIDKLLVARATEVASDPLFAEQAGSEAGENPLAPLFVSQWRELLSKTAGDPASPLAVWRILAGDPNGSLDATAPIGARFADLQTRSPAVVANRYQELFDEAIEAWTARQADEPGADSLGDPLLESLRLVLFDKSGPFAVPAEAESLYPPETAAAIKPAREGLAELEKAAPDLPLTMAVSDAEPEELRVHLRGSHLTLGEQVSRRFPRILAGEQQPPLVESASGRLELANWLASPTHPLTARVMVNRVWQWHFGEGLVRSPDNFGRLGERPTHPELLDWLARRFVDRGWSIKDLHRTILHSSAYQMSTAAGAMAAEVDPENRLVWRMNRRRLEAEAIRDSLLAVGGTLDATMQGTLLKTKNREYVAGTASVNPESYETTRRSIYLPVVRSALYDVFQAFDFADPSTPNGRRESTTVAPQALFMMNGQLAAEQTRAMAQRLLAAVDNDEDRVAQAYELAYSRPPTPAETARALEYVEGYARTLAERQVGADESRVLAWQSLCRAIVSANEFVYVE